MSNTIQPGQTFAQKALARAAGRDHAQIGEILDVTPDVILSHDNTAAIRRVWAEFGQERVRNPDRLAITLDHAVPAPTPVHAQNHKEIRAFVREQGIGQFFDAGRGICHQVLSEEVVVRPGQVILGADSHTPHFGWLGAFGAGIGRSEVAALWAQGTLWLKVPGTIRIHVTGNLPPGVTAKDLALRVIGDLGSDGGIYRSVEFTGDTVRAMSIDSRCVLPNMMAEFGAKNSFICPDETTLDYCTARLTRRLHGPGATLDQSQQVRAELVAGCLYPDADCALEAEHHYQAETLEPYVACPHHVDNVVPVSELSKVRVDQAFIGTCTNGRLEDIEAAAEILTGRNISRHVRLLVIPASSQVLQESIRLGYVNTLVGAGAMLGVPGCGPCMGNHLGIPAPGEVTISSANRNFQGRMGTPEADIYLSSPAVVAASAVTGYITDPKEL